MNKNGKRNRKSLEYVGGREIEDRRLEDREGSEDDADLIWAWGVGGRLAQGHCGSFSGVPDWGNLR